MKRLRKLTKALRAVIDVLFFCKHKNSERLMPRRDERGEYRRCLDCGRRFPWSWEEKGDEPRGLKPPVLLLPRKDKAAEELERMVNGDDA